MGIIHTAKKFIKDELYKKMRREKEFEEGRTLSDHESSLILRDAEKQSKEMNLNQVCLCFQAYMRDDMSSSWIK